MGAGPQGRDDRPVQLGVLSDQTAIFRVAAGRAFLGANSVPAADPVAPSPSHVLLPQ